MLKFNKLYYSGVRYQAFGGYVYSIYSQTNNVEKAKADAYRYSLTSGSCTSGIVLVYEGGRMYELEFQGDFELGYDGKYHPIYLPNYNKPVDSFSTYFRTQKHFAFDGVTINQI